MSYAKVDLCKTLPDLYAPTRRDWEYVDVPPLGYLMIDGAGDPNTSPDYEAAVAALYSVAYPVKFASKSELGRDYVVPPLEGLWYADDPTVFVTRDKAAFAWTMMMIMQPEWIDAAMVERAVDAARKKKPGLSHDSLRFATDRPRAAAHDPAPTRRVTAPAHRPS